VDGPALTIASVTSGAGGTATLNVDGTVTFTPTLNFNGAASFTYKATDSSLLSNTATVTVNVAAVNDAPSFAKGADITVNATAGSQTVVGWATAISAGPLNEAGQALNFIVTNNNSALFSAQPAISPTGTLTYTPALNASGVATVTVKIHDDGGQLYGGVDTSAPVNFTITVKAAYGIVPVKSLTLPPTGVTFKPSSTGTLVDVEWRFTINGIVVNSSADSLPSVTITGPAPYDGAGKTYTPGCTVTTVIACDKFIYKTDGTNTWDFHWKPKSALVGDYLVTVSSGKTGQTFGPYLVKFRN
jgi:hypothetical protein